MSPVQAVAAGPGDATATSTRLRVATVARWAYGVVLLVAVAWAAVTAHDDLRILLTGAQPLPLLAAFAASLVLIGLTSAIWTSALRSLGAVVPWRLAVTTTARSLPARYLPGSVWYAVSRAALLRARGVPGPVLATVAAVEMLVVPAVGFALGAALLAAAGRTPDVVTLPVLAAVVMLVVLTTPPVVNRVLRLVLRRRPGPVPALSWPGMARVVLWVAAFWLWSALTFALYLSSFPAIDAAVHAPLPAVLGGYMVAWGVGWLAVFAPQGVGVFEVTLAAVLGAAAPGVALLLGGYRVLVLARDVLVAAIASALGRPAAGPGPTR